MPARDNPKVEEQAYRPPEETHASDMRGLLSTLDRVFSTFREQLRTEAPKPFTGNAKIAADTFNDIVAGLKFESRRPGAVTIEATHVSPTEIELRWTDIPTNADGYRVERCQGYNCQDLDEIARLPSTARSFRDANLSERTLYRYRVVAFDARGETSSNIVEVTPGTRRHENKETR
jgi:hypothetical protein